MSDHSDVVGAPSLTDSPFSGVLASIAGDAPTPAGGAVAALATALAGALVTKCARKSGSHRADSEDLRRRAEDLTERGQRLVEVDARAYGAVLDAARGLRAAPDDADADARLREALSAAADPPLEIAAVGAELAEIAADLAASGAPALRGDACAAASMAEAAVASAVTLADLDVRAARRRSMPGGGGSVEQGEDPRTARGEALGSAAGASRARARAALGGQWE